MKRRGSETVLLWLVWLLPVGVAILAAVIGDKVFLAELARHETIRPQGYWRPAVMMIAGVAVVSGAVAVWIWTVLRRYRELIHLRESALRAFNIEREAKVEEEVRKQRLADRMLVWQAKMNAMARMSTMVAKGLKSPLEVYSDASERKQDSASVNVQKRLEEIRQRVEDYGQIFHPDTERIAVDLKESVEKVLALLEWELKQYGIAVDTRLACSTPLLLRRNEVLQIVLGVIQTAIEALLKSNIEQPRIDIECYETGQFVVIRVCYHGSGDDSESMDTVFDPDFTTKAGTASGLELFLARAVVEEHCNGELTFEKIDGDSCFHIKIGKHQEEEI